MQPAALGGSLLTALGVLSHQVGEEPGGEPWDPAEAPAYHRPSIEGGDLGVVLTGRPLVGSKTDQRVCAPF